MKVILRLKDPWYVTQETIIHIKLQVKPLMLIFLNGVTTVVCMLQIVFDHVFIVAPCILKFINYIIMKIIKQL
jgi:hypothetical protein